MIYVEMHALTFYIIHLLKKVHQPEITQCKYMLILFVINDTMSISLQTCVCFHHAMFNIHTFNYLSKILTVKRF